jgi:hypothetical protein
METSEIIAIVIGIIILFLIVKKIIKKKKFIFERTVENPSGRTTLYFIEGIEKMFSNYKDAENFARRLR